MEPVTRRHWQSAFDRATEGFGSAIGSVDSLAKLEEARVRFLGRKGELTALLKALKDLPLEDRREAGPLAQNFRELAESRLEARRVELERDSDDAALRENAIDPTLPGFHPPRGRLHPLTQVLKEMTDILGAMGFAWAEGPHVETDFYNFGALNIPEHHPARDMQDTFYLSGLPLLMRTHTSPVQIRAMQKAKPPLRIISPGRVFRHDQVDATHSSVFHQIEGLAVDRGIAFADLKGTLQVFLERLLGPGTRLRFLPSYFPFTEPSAEVSVSCFVCAGKGRGCAVCKQSGWIELLGAGLVHPNVFKAVGYDPREWSGFAFGIGVERVAMLRLGVADIRAFYENDLRFLRQFDENLV